MKPFRAFIATGGSMLALLIDANAQEVSTSGGILEEVVVTAQKREESLQKVPVAVSAFSGDMLTERGIGALAELGALTPGLKLDTGNAVTLPFLRGVGSTITSLGNESSVAVYIDGMYYTRVLPGFFSLNNIERVEVLKGPQGTLFGRNSTGGVIQIVTPLPSYQPQFRAHVGYGSYDTTKGDLYASTGLTDKVAVDVALVGTKQGEGYGKNIATGNRVYFQDDFTGRAKLLYQPADETKIVLNGYYSYVKGSGDGATYPGTTQGYASAPFDLQPTLGFFQQNNDQDNAVSAEQYGGYLTIEQGLGFAQFKSMTAYSKDDERQTYDLEKSPRPSGDALLLVDMKQFTQELQLSSLPGSALTWIGGLFYYNTTSAYEPIAFSGPLFIPGTPTHGWFQNSFNIYGKQKAKSYSAYGQATYEVLPKLKLTGGIRYTRDEANAVGQNSLTLAGQETLLGTPVVGEAKVNKTTFKVALDYQFTADVLGYTSFSRGYKSGGFNLAPVNPIAIRPETIKAYEVGLKTELFDHHLRVNTAAFYYDIGSPQVQLLEAASIRTANAGASRVKGAELEGTLAATRDLTINFGAAYLDSKYTEFSGAPAGFPNPNPPYGSTNPLLSIDAKGNRTPLAAKFTANIGATYELTSPVGKWNLSANYAYNAGYYFEPSNLFKQKAFGLIDAQAMLHPNDHVSIALWGKNLADERYVTFQSTQAGPSGFPFQPAAPRTYGVTFGYEF